MTLQELRDRITKAVTSITGEFPESISGTYFNEILENFATLENGRYVINTSDEVIIKTLNSAPSKYDGKIKRPNQAFWKRIKRDKQSQWNSAHGIRVNEYVRPSSDEIALATQIAREAQNRFKVLTPTSVGLSRRSSKADKRVAANKMYASKGFVCVEDSSSDKSGLWISRGEAIGEGLTFHDPVEWLKKRAQTGDVPRGTFKQEVSKLHGL